MSRLKLGVLAASLIPAAVVASTPDLIGVTRAVGLAETALSGRAIEAELETQDGRLVYEIDVVRNGAILKALIDARGGQLVAAEKQQIETAVRGWLDKDRLRASQRPLAPVLAGLEAETGGKVTEVGFDSEGRGAHYEIEVATAAGVADVRIDPSTGKRLPPELDD